MQALKSQGKKGVESVEQDIEDVNWWDNEPGYWRSSVVKRLMQKKNDFHWASREMIDTFDTDTTYRTKWYQNQHCKVRLAESERISYLSEIFNPRQR